MNPDPLHVEEPETPTTEPYLTRREKIRDLFLALAGLAVILGGVAYVFRVI